MRHRKLFPQRSRLVAASILVASCLELLLQWSAGPTRWTFSLCVGNGSPVMRRTTIRHRGSALQVLAHSPSVEWLDAAEGPDRQVLEGSTILPVFPLNNVKWPGNEVVLEAVEPAYRQMYDDIILSGARRFLISFSPCVRGKPGLVRFPDMLPEDRRLHAVGSVVFVEDLRQVSGGYLVKHSVLGRARIKQLLNPSALFNLDKDGWKLDYLRAEVESFNETDSVLNESAAPVLEEAWEELRQLAKKSYEPELPKMQTFKNHTIWQLADAWQEHQLEVNWFRVRNDVQGQVQAWIRLAKEEGRLPPVFASRDMPAIPSSFLPPALQQAVRQTASVRGLELSDDFWEPILQLQAAPDADEFAKLLLAMTADQVRPMRARASLYTALQ